MHNARKTLFTLIPINDAIRTVHIYICQVVSGDGFLSCSSYNHIRTHLEDHDWPPGLVADRCISWWLVPVYCTAKGCRLLVATSELLLSGATGGFSEETVFAYQTDTCKHMHCVGGLCIKEMMVVI